MNSPSNKKELERLRMQMECVDESAIELIKGGVIANGDMADLVNWLMESEENQDQLDRLQNANDSVRDATLEVPAMDPALIDRIQSKIANSSDENVDVDAAHTDISEVIYQELFDESDRQADEAKPRPVFEKTASDSQSSIGHGSVSKGSAGPRPYGRWWIGAIATVGTIAATIALIVMLTPDPEIGQTEYTAEMLCSESLTWNPNSSDAEWSSDLAQAPQDRLFPNHLFRLQAQSWKQMEIDGDANGVVYNLIPKGHLSELKAYVYVFKSDKDYQLPNQFDSHSTSNRRYKFWSVSCQQDLVFVLVYEGDEKRLHDLIKEQQVG